MTLDELLEIKSALEYGKNVNSYLDECEEALRIINRELRLKELNRMHPKYPEYDVNGRKVEE